MNEDTTQPNIPRDYAKKELPQHVVGCNVFWAILVCIISGFAFALAVFGG